MRHASHGARKLEAGEAFLRDLETRAADAGFAVDDEPEFYRKELAALPRPALAFDDSVWLRGRHPPRPRRRARTRALRKLPRLLPDPGLDGEETFYRALDRTDGTEASVFFYDLMLGEFTKGLAEVEGTKSLKLANDHLHRAFLTYRKYRSFCEAVARALLLLPHDEPPPHRLRRQD